MAKEVKKEDQLSETEMVKVTYIKDGSQAKKGETITVSKLYAELLKENGWIK